MTSARRLIPGGGVPGASQQGPERKTVPYGQMPRALPHDALR